LQALATRRVLEPPPQQQLGPECAVLALTGCRRCLPAGLVNCWNCLFCLTCVRAFVLGPELAACALFCIDANERRCAF
jgi:hypothetical protein